MNTQGYFLEATENCMAFTGYDRNKLIGKHFSEVGFTRLEYTQKLMNMIKKTLQGKPGMILELEASRKDGSALFIEAIIVLLKKRVILSDFLQS